MHEYVLHMHNHAGWFTQKIKAKSIAQALIKGLDARAGFLSKEYMGRYRIEHDDPTSEYPRFRVIWNDKTPKFFAFGRPIRKGDMWWSDRFQIGDENDCESCGGTGANHYYPGRQCWKCGDQNLDGRGTGKKQNA